MKTITSQNCNLDQPLGKWAGTVHIQQTALLAHTTGKVYVIEETFWRRYTYKMKYICTSCDAT